MKSLRDKIRARLKRFGPASKGRLAEELGADYRELSGAMDADCGIGIGAIGHCEDGYSGYVYQRLTRSAQREITQRIRQHIREDQARLRRVLAELK